MVDKIKKEYAHIITQFSLWRMIYTAFSCKKRHVYFFDLYSNYYGVFLTLFSRIVGIDRCALCLHLFFKLFNLEILQIPHGNAVEDYHKLHIESLNLTTGLVDRYFNSSSYINESFFNSVSIDKDCLDSIYLKEIGDEVLPIIENIIILKSLNYNNIIVDVDEKCISLAVLSIISNIDHVKLNKCRFLPGILNFIPYLFMSLLLLFKLFLRFFLYDRSLISNFQKIQYAIEYVDPKANLGLTTHPNFFSKNDANTSAFVYYISTCSYLKHGRKFNSPDSGSIIYIDDIKIHKRVFISACILVTALLKKSLRSRSLIVFYNNIKKIGLYSNFNNFLIMFSNIKTHCFNTYPDGDTSGMLHRFLVSGIITDACRSNDVLSISYQSRTLYSHIYHYYFDAFDKYFTWSKVWSDSFKYTQFITSYQEIGNPYVDSYFCNKVQQGAVTNDESSLLILSGDVEVCNHPLPYTYNYMLYFIKSILLALNVCNPFERITIKTKDPGQWNMLLDTSTEIVDLVQKIDCKIDSHEKKRHDTMSSILSASSVVTIGFTSPGIEAVCIGKKATYFTPYRDIYFPCIENHLNICRTVSDLVDFFNGNRPLSNTPLKIDAFCDGQSSSRLLNILRNEL